MKKNDVKREQVMVVVVLLITAVAISLGMFWQRDFFLLFLRCNVLVRHIYLSSLLYP